MLISSWVEVKAADWQTINEQSFRVTYTLASLTADVAKKGNVYFYMQPLGASFVYPLPYSEANGAKFYGGLLNTNNTQGFYLNYNNNPALGSVKLTTSYRFRVVIIPAAARIAAGVDMANYESVKAFLSLND
jgi:hypothetical protein